MAVFGLDSILTNSLANELRFGLTGNHYKVQRYLYNFGGATPLSISTAPGLTNGDWMTFFLFYGLYPYYLIEPQSNRQRQLNVVELVYADGRTPHAEIRRRLAPAGHLRGTASPVGGQLLFLMKLLC